MVGKTIPNPFCKESNKPTERHIGNYILYALKSNPNFIGQVKYFKNKIYFICKILYYLIIIQHVLQIDAETGQKITFEEMKNKSVKCALWLKTQRIRYNDVITVCTMNQLNAYVPFLAGLYVGCKVNPLDEYLVKGKLFLHDYLISYFFSHLLSKTCRKFRLFPEEDQTENNLHQRKFCYESPVCLYI